jgi:thiamine kinase
VIGPRVGEGREAEVYAWGDDAVVKLYRPGYLGHHAESVALAALDGHGLAPRLIDVVDRDGRPGWCWSGWAGRTCWDCCHASRGGCSPSRGR